MIHKSLVILICIIGLFTNIQSSPAAMRVSDDEKAVFAYLKLTEQRPNLETWITNSDKYIEATREEQEKILQEERTRLDWGFGTYDVEKDFITIKSKIRLTTGLNEDGKRFIYTRFVDDRHNDTPYFPFQYGKDSIAFVIQNLEEYRTIALKPEEIPKIKQYFYDSAPYEAEIEIRVRPISADAQEKLLVDYKDQWLMLGDIAYLKISFYDEFKLENVNVWDYNAPWYLDESQRALLNMFKETE